MIMSRRGSSSIPVQIQCLNDDSTSSSIRNEIFRRTSTLSNKSDNELVERRSSLRNLFSKADERSSSLRNLFSKADENDDLQDEHRLQLFKSEEFQAYLKEHNIVATAGLHIIFQQFLQEGSSDDKRTNERVGVTASAYRRKSSGDSLRSFAGGYTTSSSKRRGTNASEHSRLSDNSLEDSMWSIDDSSRRNYMSAIRGDTESIFRQPQEVKETELQLMNDVADEEESKLKSFFRKSSDAMSSIDASYRNRRDSFLSSISGRGLASSMPSGDTRWEASCKVEKGVGNDSSVAYEDLMKTPSDISVRFEDLMKTRGDNNDDAHEDDDKSNNGEVEIFFSTRRRSLSCSDAPPRRSSLLSEDDESNNGEVEVFFPSRRRSSSYDTPPRRASLISRASETSSQLQKCLNEIRVENIRSSLRSVRVDDEESNASDDGNSLGTKSVASDQAFLCTSNDAAKDALPHHPQTECCRLNSAISAQLKDDFLASGDTLLVEWGEGEC